VSNVFVRDTTEHPALYLGIDPGGSGAAVAITTKGEFHALVVPDFRNKQLVGDALDWLTNLAPFIRCATIEKPPMMFQKRNIVKSIMAVTMNAGVWLGVLGALDITDVRWCEPRQWQAKILGKVPKGETKAASCRVAGQIFGPSFAQAVAMWGDGVADAANLAEYGRQMDYSKRITENR
jgi:hypothetical protein